MSVSVQGDGNSYGKVMAIVIMGRARMDDGNGGGGGW